MKNLPILYALNYIYFEQMLYIIGKRDFCEVKEVYGVTKKCRLGGKSWVNYFNFLLRVGPGAKPELRAFFNQVLGLSKNRLHSISEQSVSSLPFHSIFTIFTELCFPLIGIERLQQMLHVDDAKPVVNNTSSSADSSHSPERDSSGTPSNTARDDASQLKNILVF